jgi:5'-nucleotidase (lipoprotein e(P4) family)
MRTLVYACGLLAVSMPLLVNAQQPALLPQNLGIKYTRDSQEYATLARQVYRAAEQAVRTAAPALPKGSWVVSLDIDETALDNSTYQLEREAYRLPFDPISWNAWVMRQQAPAIPGVSEFAQTVHQLGGHIAWISNRDVQTLEATRANLTAHQLWSDQDRLCLQAQTTPRPTKRMRRSEVLAGRGGCSWPDTKMRFVTFVGDQMGDFPEADEGIPDTGTDLAFGRTCFLLPQAMYGDWVTRVTRTQP